jgi:hypothetical protein
MMAHCQKLLKSRMFFDLMFISCLLGTGFAAGYIFRDQVSKRRRSRYLLSGLPPQRVNPTARRIFDVEVEDMTNRQNAGQRRHPERT